MKNKLPFIVIVIAITGILFFVYQDARQVDRFGIVDSRQPQQRITPVDSSDTIKAAVLSPDTQDWESRIKAHLGAAYWDKDTIDAVLRVNRNFFQIYQEEYPRALKRQTVMLAKLGQYPHVMPVIRAYPETATLLSQAYEPAKLARVLQTDDCYDVFNGLFVQHSHPTDAAELVHALELHGHLICRLIQKGLVGAQTLFLYPYETPAGKPYGEWVHEVLETALYGTDETLTSTYNLLLEQGSAIRHRMVEDETFRHRFRSVLWPRLSRTVQKSGKPFEFYMGEPYLWDLADHPDGERLLEQWVWLVDKVSINPAELLYGDYAYPPPLHEMLIIALLTENEGVLVPLLYYGHELPFVHLIEQGLPDTVRYALFKRLNEAGDNYPNELNMLASLEYTALIDELGEESMAFLPGQDTWNALKKTAQGRPVSAGDVAWAVVDVADIGFTLFTLGAGAALTTSLKQTAKAGLKVGGKTAAKTAAKEVMTTQLKQIAKKKLSSHFGSAALKQVSDKVLQPWLKSELVSALRNTFSKEAMKTAGKESVKRGFDVTPVVRWIFQTGKANRNTMKTLSGLDARLFMRQDAKVLVQVNKQQLLGTATSEFLQQTAGIAGGEVLTEVIETEATQAVVRAGTRIAQTATDSVQAWQQNVSAWWSLQATGLANGF